ncbi:hypothetical protein NPX99_05435 [Bartonella sp. 220]|uniref:hypothetical protein n=1 Tax=Bartonella sp. 220B TaxID=2967260 RepID=UPI0022A93777|nr:hypothetical protein [Bartonella sp. 220B]MCZ2158715.1 hypothetical protein [Bartonella sp. 220B]
MREEHPQRFFDLQKKEKERERQNLGADTKANSFLFKKWLTFSRKNYVIICVISLIIMAYKGYLYKTFFQDIGHHGDQMRIANAAIVFSALAFLSACVLATVPVILVFRAVLTSQLKKKIQRLEEFTLQQE